jgi:hypothetical protein
MQKFILSCVVFSNGDARLPKHVTVATIQIFDTSMASAYNRALVWASGRIHEITLFQNSIRPTIHPALYPD